MVISRKRTLPQHPQLTKDNVILQEVDHHRHLSIKFSSDLTWHNHIIEIVNIGWQRLNVLRAIKFKFDRKSLKSMQISFVRPALEYSGVVWENCNNQDKKHLESIQIEAMRIVTGATKLCSIGELYTETGWETLEARRENRNQSYSLKWLTVSLLPPYGSQYPTQSMISLNICLEMQIICLQSIRTFHCIIIGFSHPH